MKNNPTKPQVSRDLSARRAKKLTILFALIFPLIRVIVLFPLMQIAISNSGPGVAYYIIYYASNLLTHTGLFAAIGIVIYQIYSAKPIGFAVSCQTFSLIFIAVLLQAFIFWLLAFLDEAILTSLPFSISNYTLSQVEAGELVNALMSSFAGIIPIILIFFISIGISLCLYQRAKRRGADLSPSVPTADGTSARFVLLPPIKASLIVFIVLTAINLITETVLTLIKYHGAIGIAELPGLLSPYILLLIYATLGYYVMLLVPGWVKR